MLLSIAGIALDVSYSVCKWCVVNGYYMVAGYPVNKEDLILKRLEELDEKIENLDKLEKKIKLEKENS